MKRNFKDYFAVSLKGVAMGAADVVPGVSGGTIAFISGIYEELINSIKSINISSVRNLFKQGIRTFWKSINGNFLLALFIGILISVVSLAKALKYVLETHPILIWSFFFGLIIASAVFVARKITKWNATVIISMIAGIIAAYYITIITPASPNEAYWFIFVAGAIAICAMILPGISGSFILVLLGMYKYVLHAVSEFNLLIIAIFALGAVIGLLSFSNLLSWLLKRFHNATIAVLAGFMIGSLNKVWPWKKVVEWGVDRHGENVPVIQENVLPGAYAQLNSTEFTGITNDPQTLYAILLAIAGVLLIIGFEVFTRQSRQQELDKSIDLQ